MRISKLLFVPVLSLISLLFFSTPIFAGGGNAYINVTETDDPHWMIVRVYVNPTNVNCQGMIATFNFGNPEDGDKISGSNGDNTSTAGDAAYETINGKQYLRCSTYAKVYAKNFEMNRQFRVSVKGSNIDEYRGSAVSFDSYNYPNNLVLLPWEVSPNYIPPTTSPVPTPIATPSITPLDAPQMVYPADKQELDLERAYMFKVQPVEGASGYLFGLFQDGGVIFDNYRDGKYLSSNGEFALWESSPFHAKFHSGEMRVTIRALVNGMWTEAREITVILKSRGGSGTTPISSTQSSTLVTQVALPAPPTITSTQQIITVTDSSASAALQKRIDELQNKLEQSQQKQSALEERLNQIISWIKSVFPFFK